MPRTVDLSLSTRTQQYLVAGVVAVNLVPVVLVSLWWLLDLPLGWPLAAAIVVGVVAVPVLWVGAASAEDGEDDGTVWDLIPRHHYGHLVEGGSLGQAEREDALPEEDR